MTTTVEIESIANAIAASAAAANRLDQLVDRYAELHAQISDAETEMSIIKAQLVASGQVRVKGTFLTAAISFAAPARRTDWKGVANEMKAPKEVIDLHTKTAESGNVTVRLVAN